MASLADLYPVANGQAQPVQPPQSRNPLTALMDYAGRGAAVADLYTGGMLSSLAGLNPFTSYQSVMDARDRALDGVPRDIKAAASEPINPLVAMAALPAAAAKKAEQATQKGIRAYHGSPHDFDKFDLSKIGTGEGAQAYGHGLYFAESEGVAKSYRDRLSDKSWGGKSFDPSDPRITAGMALDLAKGDVGAARNELMAAVQSYEKMGWADDAANARAALAHIEDGSALRQQSAGKMYEVNINAHPDDFLDWDKPLSQQSGKIQQAFDYRNHTISDGQIEAARAAGRNAEADFLEGQRRSLESRAGMRPSEVYDLGSPDMTSKLREAGIPGIKYLDAGSRGAGDGSRNYVLFRDDIISIVRKYGMAAAVSMYGADAVTQAMGDGQEAQP